MILNDVKGKGDPRDGIFYPTLTLIMDSYNSPEPLIFSYVILTSCDDTGANVPISIRFSQMR